MHYQRPVLRQVGAHGGYDMVPGFLTVAAKLRRHALRGNEGRRVGAGRVQGQALHENSLQAAALGVFDFEIRL
ncbi:hypothetical protein GCM10022407_39260 [Hymenobacter antarcticus]|uniref:Uncharacterized protein n=1 Tax=Hymenobacter antarcticus TaxID=486270 RepID=A0ABP7R329_9BACT